MLKSHTLVHLIRYIFFELKFKLRQIIKWHHPRKKTLYFHCHYHYGDNIQNVVFLDKLARQLSDIRIYYGILESQIPQIQEFVSQENLIVVSINKVAFNSFDLWKNRYLYWHNSPIKHSYYNFYMDFFSYVSNKLGIVNPIISNYDLLTEIDYKLEEYQKFDVLIVNSAPNSSQFKYSDNALTKVIEKLAENFKVMTTCKISGINCTTDASMTLKEIGEFSLFCNVIVTISTGPSWSVLNKKNFDSGKPVLILIDESEVVSFNSNSQTSSSIDEIIPFVKKFNNRNI